MPKLNRAALSKSLFIRGMQCHRSLYQHKYFPERKNDLDASQEAKLATGNEVGELAQQLFPHVVLVPYEGLSIPSQLRLTSSLIENRVKTIYEASFQLAAPGSHAHRSIKSPSTRPPPIWQGRVCSFVPQGETYTLTKTSAIIVGSGNAVVTEAVSLMEGI
ncbi:MAG: hypothetical protein JXR59_08725 [Desulfuromonadaceae bacterium]|nr:hypothetical protein [Desulfuromonadaceae bacterium]